MTNIDSSVFRMYFSTLKTGMMIESSLTLYRIHETLLYLVENNNANSEKNDHENKTINEPSPADKLSGAEKTILERLDDRSYRIETHEFMDRDSEICHTLRLAQRIDDRSSVHPKLNQK